MMRSHWIEIAVDLRIPFSNRVLFFFKFDEQKRQSKLKVSSSALFDKMVKSRRCICTILSIDLVEFHN